MATVAAPNKKNKFNPWIILIVIAIVLLIANAVRAHNRAMNEMNADKKPSSGGGSSSSSSGKLPSIGDNGIQKVGVVSEETLDLQRIYNSKYAVPNGLSKITEDGKFGTQTQGAVNTVLGKNTTTLTEWESHFDVSSNGSDNDESSWGAFLSGLEGGLGL